MTSIIQDDSSFQIHLTVINNGEIVIGVKDRILANWTQKIQALLNDRMAQVVDIRQGAQHNNNETFILYIITTNTMQ